MKTKIVLLFVLSLIGSFICEAKEGYTIKAQVKNNVDTVLYLAHYFAKAQRVYKIDSAFADANGNYIFKSDSLKNGGIYLFVTRKNASLLEFLLQKGDNFSVVLDKNNPVATAEFIGSEENTDFAASQKNLIDIQNSYNQNMQKMALAKNKKDSLKVDELNIVLGKSLKQYRNSFIQRKPKSFVASLFNSMEEPEIPAAITEADKKRGKKELKSGEITAYSYYKKNYWNTFDFSNDAIMNTPIYEKKLDDYLKMVLSVPDSFNKEADIHLAKCRASKEIFKYTLNHLTYYAETSKIMGMDESFVYLVENYYMKGDAKDWLHDTVLAKYIDRARAIAPNMIGQIAADIRIPDINENIISLRDYCKGQDYTLLIFYAPTCGHCRKEVPASDSTVRALRKEKINIKIFGIENEREDEKWRALIKEFNLEGDYWLHAHDPNHVGNFVRNFDVRTNPVLYLLDRNSKIVGKRIDHSNLAGLVRNLEKQKKTKS